MGMRIHDGYFLKIGGAAGLRAFFEALAPRLKSASLELVAGHLAVRATEIHDCLTLGRPFHLDTRDGDGSAYLGGENQPLSLAGAELDAAHARVRQSDRRDVFRDFNANIFLMPIGRRGFLVRFVSEKSEYVRIWESCKEVVPFAYSDGCERSSDMPPREWAKRKKLWRTWSPVTVFSWELIGRGLPWICDDLVSKHIPAVKWRAHELAVCDFQNAQVKVYRKKWLQSHSGEMGISDIVHGITLASKRAETAYGRREIAKREKVLRGKMVKLSVKGLRAVQVPAKLERRWMS